jgi:hypothetical protein
MEIKWHQLEAKIKLQKCQENNGFVPDLFMASKFLTVALLWGRQQSLHKNKRRIKMAQSSSLQI